VRVSEETNIELLRKKAEVLECENERLSKRVGDLLREVLTLKGMGPEQVDLNLPGLLEQVTKPKSGGLTKPGSERRANFDKEKKTREPQVGHGPTEQPELEVQEELFEVDEADKVCPVCGEKLEDWDGHEDETEVIDVVERRWVLKKATLKKCRCPRGCHVETALGPERMIKGGRYTPGVAVAAATAKYPGSGRRPDQGLRLDPPRHRARRTAPGLRSLVERDGPGPGPARSWRNALARASAGTTRRERAGTLLPANRGRALPRLPDEPVRRVEMPASIARPAYPGRALGERSDPALFVRRRRR